MSLKCWNWESEERNCCSFGISFVFYFVFTGASNSRAKINQKTFKTGQRPANHSNWRKKRETFHLPPQHPHQRFTVAVVRNSTNEDASMPRPAAPPTLWWIVKALANGLRTNHWAYCNWTQLIGLYCVLPVSWSHILHLKQNQNE